ncbi:MAG: sulfotransferase domain-containing protein [Planctomycetes bacterium]|nr:sulfotransferase domain-containing protein [Planctomycetota bacterium]
MLLDPFAPRRLFAAVLRKPLKALYSDRFIYSLLTRNRSHMWVIAAPKSGSTWLSAILQNYLGWESRCLARVCDRREQEPSLRQLAAASMIDNVLWTHQHTRASKPTLELIQRAQILPIIQTRNVHDTVMSMSDHFDRESTVCSMAYMDEFHWSQLDADRKRQFIIDMVMPWYFNFYAGWLSSSLVRDKIAFVCRYEDLKKDPVGEVVQICNHFGLPVDESKIQAAIDLSSSQPTRRNKGVIGRGNMLSDAQKATLSRLRDYYSDVDFSAAGFDY